MASGSRCQRDRNVDGKQEKTHFEENGKIVDDLHEAMSEVNDDT